MRTTTEQPPTEKTKWLRALRYFGFSALLGGVIGVSAAIPPLADIKRTIVQSGLYLAIACIIMIGVEVLLIAFSGSWGFDSLTRTWKAQLLELSALIGAMATASMIARLIEHFIPISTENTALGILLALTYYVAGLLILAPFQVLATRRFRKRSE